MSHNTYLGQKGYSIYKKSLSLKEQVYIREELTVKAYIPKSPVQPPAYPIYRESSKKFYIPRYFGISTFGIPNECRISKGIPINIKFEGKLRENQQKIVEKFINHIKSCDINSGGGGLLDLHTGFGKTVLGLNILAQIGLKTLIIVHKGFLVDQWIERITQFLPAARVGKIQAQVIDTEDKDIVIGMLQSLSMKEYPDDQFAEFGLTILDEIHHLSAEVFCRALQKICTIYTLGLSATMNRKDGLSKVFKMFIGDIIHKEKRDDETKVIVKAIDFKTEDEEFNEMEYDYRGNAKYSTMISKLCNFNIRSELIINVIINELKINPNQQVMILGHNKVLLVYLYKAIEYRKFASVGYYIGGMKQVDLKISETKQIIIATYSMASEGLDIKTLTTLVLATPKTDIEQAVGRILRVKDNNPLIIDIIDQHDIFKKQWAKRRAFYKKNNYKIMHTDNYNRGNPNWTEISKKAKGEEKTNTHDILETDNLNELIKGKCMISINI
jgi:superfamily II DNA or RNA helicase